MDHRGVSPRSFVEIALIMQKYCTLMHISCIHLLWWHVPIDMRHKCHRGCPRLPLAARACQQKLANQTGVWQRFQLNALMLQYRAYRVKVDGIRLPCNWFITPWAFKRTLLTAFFSPSDPGEKFYSCFQSKPLELVVSTHPKKICLSNWIIPSSFESTSA